MGRPPVIWIIRVDESWRERKREREMVDEVLNVESR